MEILIPTYTSTYVSFIPITLVVSWNPSIWQLLIFADDRNRLKQSNQCFSDIFRICLGSFSSEGFHNLS